jgi:hypothetical protein
MMSDQVTFGRCYFIRDDVQSLVDLLMGKAKTPTKKNQIAAPKAFVIHLKWTAVEREAVKDKRLATASLFTAARHQRAASIINRIEKV